MPVSLLVIHGAIKDDRSVARSSVSAADITSRPGSTFASSSPSPPSVAGWHAGPGLTRRARWIERECALGPLFSEGAQLKMMRQWQEGGEMLLGWFTYTRQRERDGRLPLRDEPTSERIKRQVGETDEDQVGTGRTDGRSDRDVCIERKG